MLDQIIIESFKEELISKSLSNTTYIFSYYEVDSKFIFVPYEVTKNDIDKFKSHNSEEFNFESYIDEITQEIAAFIQANISNHNYIKFDIYLFIEIDCSIVDINQEDILKIENDKFCCRKIIFNYDKSQPNCIDLYRSQFQKKFLFSHILRSFLDVDNLHEELAVKSIVNGKNGCEIIDVDGQYTFSNLKSKLASIYARYDIQNN